MQRIPIPTMAAGRQAQVVWSQWYYAHQAHRALQVGYRVPFSVGR
jgi:hypothetical protein